MLIIFIINITVRKLNIGNRVDMKNIDEYQHISIIGLVLDEDKIKYMDSKYLFMQKTQKVKITIGRILFY